MKTTTVETSQLSGAALDWAVAKALGWEMRRVPNDIDGQNGGDVLAPPDLSGDFQFPPRGKVAPWYFVRRWSSDWSQGGPLIEKLEGLTQDDDGNWYAIPSSEYGVIELSGPTPLIAACRAIVAAELGDDVEVPTELVEVRDA